jgi:hypothetical protein
LVTSLTKCTRRATSALHIWSLRCVNSVQDKLI